MHNISQVPGDFLSRLQTSLLLTQVPIYTCQYVNDTPLHRHTSVWDLLKRHPSITAVKCVGRHAEGNSNSRLWFWRMTGNKTSQKASGQDQQQWLMREDGTDKLRHRLSVLHGPPITTAALCAHGSSQTLATPAAVAVWWPKQQHQSIRVIETQM